MNPHQDFDGGGLAGAVGPQQAEDLAGADVQRQILQGYGFAVFKADFEATELGVDHVAHIDFTQSLGFDDAHASIPEVRLIRRA